MVLGSGSHFVGQYNHSLDAKDRLTIPSKWRSSAIDQKSDWDYMLLPMSGPHIAVFTGDMIAVFMEKARAISMGDAEGLATMRKLFSRADQVKCSTQGRINLNKALMNHAGIKRDVVLVGNLTRFEIWNPEALEKNLGGDGNPEETNQILMRMGL
jgi:MraZ protein